jgi:BirA family biotin operon repressor/biotin-[acetyl-CoA-carboxylase] ligase
MFFFTHDIRHYPEIDSTNAEIIRLAKPGQLRSGMAIWAAKQDTGRWRHGRNWVSKEGNLYYSIYLNLPRTLAQVAQLSFVAALATIDALEEATGEKIPFTLKWPNDVLLHGKKIAGILLESIAADGGHTELVIGIGINLKNHPDGTAYPATHLSAEGYALLRPESVAQILTQKLHDAIQAWGDQGFRPFREAWLAQAQGIGEMITVKAENELDNDLKGVFEEL